MCLQGVRGDNNVKPSPVKKVCGAGQGGTRMKDRKTSKSWNTYYDEDKKEQE